MALEVAREELERVKAEAEAAISRAAERVKAAEEESVAAVPVLAEQRLLAEVREMQGTDVLVATLKRFGAEPAERAEEAAPEEASLATLDGDGRRRLVTACCEQLCALNEKDAKNRQRAASDGAVEALLEAIGEVEPVAAAPATAWGDRTRLGERGDLYACLSALSSIARGAGLQQVLLDAGAVEVATRSIARLAQPAATALKYMTTGESACSEEAANAARAAGARDEWLGGGL